MYCRSVPPSQTTLGLSQSAGPVSLQQAFSELRQNQNLFDPGPSTAPASIHSTHPLLLLAPALPQAGTVTPTVDPAVGLVSSSLNQMHDQVLDGCPLGSTSPPSSLPTICLSPPCSYSPPPVVVNQSILQSQMLSQAVMQVVSQSQAQAQVLGQAQIQPQTQSASAVNATSVPPSTISNIPPSLLASPPPAQTFPPVSSSSSSTLTASEVSSDPQLVNPVCSLATSLSSSVIPTTAILGPQVVPSAASQPTPLLSFSSPLVLQPVTTNVPSVQPTLVHAQPQTAALPGQTHTHCAECDAR